MHSKEPTFLELIRVINQLLVYQGYEAPVEVDPWIAEMIRIIEDNTGEVMWK
jgi:hypothetical protein